MRSLCTHRFQANAKLFCKWKHTSNSFLQSSAPTNNFAPPSLLHEREKNKQWTRWAITVHQKFCSEKKKLPAAIFTHTKPSFKIIRENILLSENQKEKVLRKNSLYYTEKNSGFVRVFCEIFYTLFTFDFTIAKKYTSIIQRKIQVLLMCFEKNIWLSTKIYSFVVCNVVCKIELWYNNYIKSFINSCKVGYGDLRAIW